MPRQPIVLGLIAVLQRKSHRFAAMAIVAAAMVFVVTDRANSQPPSDNNAPVTAPPSDAGRHAQEDDESANRQAELDAAFAHMLSGATLEGSFTSTGEGNDLTKLSREKYTIGNVKRLGGKFWLIPSRIQYGEHDVTLPITVPIEWAGDTPLIVVDNVPLPGFGTVSARVMFFADHYAGYWRHGNHGGHLFGVIRRDKHADAPTIAPSSEKSSVDEASAGQKPKDQGGKHQAVDDKD